MLPSPSCHRPLVPVLPVLLRLLLFISCWFSLASALSLAQLRSPLVQIVGDASAEGPLPYVPMTDSDPLPQRASLLCVAQQPPSPRDGLAVSATQPQRFAQLCARLMDLEMVPQGQKRHFWSGRIAALEGRHRGAGSGIVGGTERENAKRSYDYIRFG